MQHCKSMFLPFFFFDEGHNQIPLWDTVGHDFSGKNAVTQKTGPSVQVSQQETCLYCTACPSDSQSHSPNGFLSGLMTSRYSCWGQVRSSFSSSLCCWNRYIHTLLQTCPALSSLTQRCPFPLSCQNDCALFSMSIWGRQTTMNHRWSFYSRGSNSWELISCFCFCPLIGVYAQQSVSYNLFVFQPLLSPIFHLCLSVFGPRN